MALKHWKRKAVLAGLTGMLAFSPYGGQQWFHQLKTSISGEKVIGELNDSLKRKRFPTSWYNAEVSVGGSKVRVLFPGALQPENKCASCHSLDEQAKLVALKHWTIAKQMAEKVGGNHEDFLPDYLVRVPAENLDNPTDKNKGDTHTYGEAKLIPSAVFLPINTDGRTIRHEQQHLAQEEYTNTLNEMGAYLSAKNPKSFEEKEGYLSGKNAAHNEYRVRETMRDLKKLAGVENEHEGSPSLNDVCRKALHHYGKYTSFWYPLTLFLKAPTLPIEVYSTLHFKPKTGVGSLERQKAVELMRGLIISWKTLNERPLKPEFLSRIAKLIPLAKAREKALDLYYNALNALFVKNGAIDYSADVFLPHMATSNYVMRLINENIRKDFKTFKDLATRNRIARKQAWLGSQIKTMQGLIDKREEIARKAKHVMPVIRKQPNKSR